MFMHRKLENKYGGSIALPQAEESSALHNLFQYLVAADGTKLAAKMAYCYLADVMRVNFCLKQVFLNIRQNDFPSPDLCLQVIRLFDNLQHFI